MKKSRFAHRLFKSTRLISLVVCFVILLSLEIAPLHAQLNSENSNVFPQVSAQVWDLTNDDGQTASVIVQPFTNSGTFSETSNSAGWWMLDNVGNHAFRFNVGGNIVHDSGGDRWDFVNFGGSGSGYQSIGTATGTANGNFPYATSVSGTYTLTTTSGYGTASGSGTWSGVLVSGAPSGSTSNPTATPQGQLAARYYGNIASTKGQASISSSSGNTPTSTGQIASGTEIMTGDNGIVGFEPPNQGGEVYLGADSEAGWVGLTSEPAPDNGIQYIVYPHVSSGLIFPNGDEQLLEMAGTVPLDVAIAVLVFSEPLGQAAAIGLIIEGGAFLVPNGIAYIKETVSHLLVVPQGAIAGGNTEYTVSVTADGTTTVQVLDGPVYFMDPVSNNTITVNTNQMLTLPAAQQNGFTTQELQSDVSSLNSTSVNHWWTQASTSTSILNAPMNMSLMFAVVAIVIVAVAAVAASIVRKRKVIRQINETELSAVPPGSKPKTEEASTFASTAAPSVQTFFEQSKMRFCPNCGQQLPQNKNFCPYCGSDLNAR